MGLSGTHSWTRNTTTNDTSNCTIYDVGGNASNGVKINGTYFFIYRYYQALGPVEYKYNRCICTITTDASGCSSLSFSCAGAKDAGNILYWKVTSSRTLDTSGMTQCSFSNGTHSGTMSVKLLPNTTYYVLFYSTQGGNENGLRMNGTLTINGSGTYGSPGEITANNTNFDSPITMSYASATSGGTYTVKVKVGTSSEVTLQTQSSTSSRSWTPSLATYGSSYPNQSSVSCVITVSTYFGGALSGTKTKTVTISFTAAQAGPSTSGAFSIAPYNTSPISGMTGYIQNYSKIRASFNSSNVTRQYGASISKWTVKFGSASAVDVAAGTATKDSGVISGTTTVVCTVVDSRGFTASETYTATITPYQTPSIAVDGFRCDGSAIADDAGSYVAITASSIYASIEDQNTITVQAFSKLASAQSYGAAVDITGGTTTPSGTNKTYAISDFLISGYADAVYDIKVVATDALGNTDTKYLKITSQAWALHFRDGGQGAAIGKAAERDNELDIGGWTLTCGNIDCNNISTINGWTVVEWGNGLIEAYTHLSGSLTHYAVVGAFYGYYTSVALPVQMANNDYFISQTWQIGSGFTWTGATLSKTVNSCNIYAVATSSGTQRYDCYLYVRGLKA